MVDICQIYIYLKFAFLLYFVIQKALASAYFGPRKIRLADLVSFGRLNKSSCYFIGHYSKIMLQLVRDIPWVFMKASAFIQHALEKARTTSACF